MDYQNVRQELKYRNKPLHTKVLFLKRNADSGEQKKCIIIYNCVDLKALQAVFCSYFSEKNTNIKSKYKNKKKQYYSNYVSKEKNWQFDLV